jgi:hypothetical protein
MVYLRCRYKVVAGMGEWGRSSAAIGSEAIDDDRVWVWLSASIFIILVAFEKGWMVNGVSGTARESVVEEFC